ncbi:MAG TPA: DNA starvation/stationary phase protection protein [Actinocrinis sp.]|jgi:starvation-inducible DNA-binding protein
MTTGTKTTRHATAADLGTGYSGFTASPKLAGNLQRVLVDLIALHVNAKQAHWNVVGPNFRDTHLLLDEITAEAREHADTIAERLRALDAVPDGRPHTVAADTSLPQLPAGEQSTAKIVDLMVEQLRGTVATARAVHDEVDAEDPPTADLLHALIDGLEKLAWMTAAENRGQ